MNIGIKIYGILSIIFSSLFTTVAVTELLRRPIVLNVAYLVNSLGWFIFGIGVLKRLPWARIGLVVVAAIYLVDSVGYPSYILTAIKNNDIVKLAAVGISLTFFGSLILFFARPNVRREFEKKPSNWSSLF